jgi:hypothetical protein
MKFIDGPGDVAAYTPGLPEGARTDDDTDIEWTYVSEMEQTGKTLLSPAQVRNLWRRHINRGIWCANQYARDLMDLGLEPPLTGRTAITICPGNSVPGEMPLRLADEGRQAAFLYLEEELVAPPAGSVERVAYFALAPDFEAARAYTCLKDYE